MSIVSITKNTGNVRFELCIDDMYIPNWKGLVDVGFLEVITVPLGDNTSEEVYFFKDPIHVPVFKAFYASKIKKVTDPYLVTILTRVLYLNPDPDKQLQKYIVEGVLSRFVHKVEVESEVLSGTKLIPCLTFEQVNSVLQTLLLTAYKDYKPVTNRRVFFKRDSKIPKNVKISISLQTRSNWVRDVVSAMIHEIAQYLDEVDDLQYITSSRIVSENLYLTPHKVNKYTSPSTTEFIEESNRARFFKTDKSVKKFTKYLELRESGIGVLEACRQIGVSNTTRSEFSRIEDILNSNI